MYTHNQIIGLLTRIAQDHWQIKSMGFGELTDMSHINLLYSVDGVLNPQAPAFPLMWGLLKNSLLINTQATTAPELQKNYTIVVCDKINPDESNKDDILSDCEQICLDIIGILQDASYNDYFFVNKTAQLNPFVDQQETDDSAIGWTFDITFRQSFFNRCDIPAAIPSPLPQS
ncbi:MAG: hypothetical protein WCJ33_00335 [Pseudomonadota bacterium]